MSFSKSPKYINKQDGLVKAMKYCAYQERCHSEVRNKLLEIGMRGDELEEVIVRLIEENFLNEERFAQTFARGKFRLKKWGRMKIKQELEKKKVSAYCIKKGMEEIDTNRYHEVLNDLIESKLKTIKDKNMYTRKSKAAKYVISKGYEPELVWSLLKK